MKCNNAPAFKHDTAGEVKIVFSPEIGIKIKEGNLRITESCTTVFFQILKEKFLTI